MHGGRQAEPVEHPDTPGRRRVSGEILQHKLCGRFLERSDNGRGIGVLGRPDQEVKRLRPEHVAHDLKTKQAAQTIEGFNKTLLEAERVKHSRTMIGAARNKRQRVEALVVAQTGQGEILLRHPPYGLHLVLFVHTKRTYFTSLYGITRVAPTLPLMNAPDEHAQHLRHRVLSMACPGFLTVPQGGMLAPPPLSSEIAIDREPLGANGQFVLSKQWMPLWVVMNDSLDREIQAASLP